MKIPHSFTARLSFLVVAFASAALMFCVGVLSGCKEGDTTQTRWVPDGCRTVPVENDVLPSRVAFRNFHSDEASTDEISIAFAPVFREGWTVDPEIFHATGPVFDSDGNLYLSPGLPYESVALISLDPKDGERRFTIPNTTGAASGGGTPMVLSGPGMGEGEEPREMIVLGLYDRAFAVDVDGAVLWDVPTGLTSEELHFVFGVNYAPAVDAIVGVTDDGFVYALDRRTGQPAIEQPFELPGENSPEGDPRGSELPLEVTICVALELGKLANLSDFDVSLLISFLNGNGVQVANHFSIDANTSNVWIAATAPDAEDGEVDGVSKFGALYKLEFVRRGDGYELEELCHASFEGGSSSTPALRKDGSRVYTSNNEGRLLAIETADCSRVWDLDVGGVINGSIAVSSDNHELYVNTRGGIVQVFDRGDEGVVGWMSDMDALDVPPETVALNTTVPAIGANAISMQFGAGIPPNDFIKAGLAQLDRATGEVRYFAYGGETTTAVMNTGPDGSVYIGNSPFRRAITNCKAEYGLLAFGGAPITGGVTKLEAERLDLLVRDAVCAAADRATNAGAHRNECPESASADIVQVKELIAQARWAGLQAVDDGDLSTQDWTSIEAELATAEQELDQGGLEGLIPASETLGGGCGMLETTLAEPTAT